MAKKLREYVDKDHSVMQTYYDLCERYAEAGGTKALKQQLEQLIEKDADFLDSYLLLGEILREGGDDAAADELLDVAYDRALKLITDKRGNWPDVLEWGWLENRHIIRALENKATMLWQGGQTDEALELLRKLLKTNPNDNIGARHSILAIRMGMTSADFEDRFDKGGYYDSELTDWFDANYSKFPDEFGWWAKAVEAEM